MHVPKQSSVDRLQEGFQRQTMFAPDYAGNPEFPIRWWKYQARLQATNTANTIPHLDVDETMRNGTLALRASSSSEPWPAEDTVGESMPKRMRLHGKQCLRYFDPEVSEPPESEASETASMHSTECATSLQATVVALVTKRIEKCRWHEKEPKNWPRQRCEKCKAAMRLTAL